MASRHVQLSFCQPLLRYLLQCCGQRHSDLRGLLLMPSQSRNQLHGRALCGQGTRVGEGPAGRQQSGMCHVAGGLVSSKTAECLHITHNGGTAVAP